MSPKHESVVELAGKRRDADRAELARAVEAGDWAAAFDLFTANLHELEGHVNAGTRATQEVRDELRQLGAAWVRANEQIGAAVVALEEAKRAAIEAKSAADRSQQTAILASERAAEAVIQRAALGAQLAVEHDARISRHELIVEEVRADRGARLSVWWRRNRWPLVGTIAGLVVSSTAAALVTWLLTRK